MKQENQELHAGIGVKLLSAANVTLRIVGGAIFFALSWYAMRYTQYIPKYYDEIPLNQADSMVKNLLGVGLAVLVLIGIFMLEKRLSTRVQTWVMRIMIAAQSLWMGGCGLVWITLTDRKPVGDQAFIYGGASYFIEGDYSFLNKGAYYDTCPHQLGLLALVELFFRFVGTYNYFACQLINVALTVGISILGYLLVRQMTDHMAVAVAYCISMSACLPLIFYTGWVYGDIPSIFFMLLTALCLLRYTKSGHGGWLAGIVFSMTMAILVRENSIIMLIALCLSAGVYAVQKKDKKVILTLMLSILLPWLVYMGISKMYQVRAGTEPSGGMPAISYVAMGMQESNGKYGWYTQYAREVYRDSGFSPKLASQISRQDVKIRLNDFANDPSYAWQFYREKVLSQWNQPMYQSMFFSAQYAEGREPAFSSIETKLHWQYLPKILAFCDRLQFILYLGTMCYFLFAVNKKSNIVQHLLAATIIGGFLFSIIWEAKARYVLPYYLMMYSLAAVGYWQLLCRIKLLVDRLGKRKGRNIV